MSHEKGRPRKGNEVRVTRSIRIEPSYKGIIEKTHGTIQNWFDKKLKEEFGEIQEIEVVKSKEEITEDDF